MVFVRVNCFVVRGCAVSRMYTNGCNCNMFTVVIVLLGQLNFCVVCINGRMYVSCSKCDVVSNECNEPTSAFCNLSVRPFIYH